MQLELWVILTLITSVFASPLRIPKPTEDDFYKAPDGFEDEKLGTILKWRKSPAKLKAVGGFPVKIANSWQMLIRSEDALGNPLPIVSSVLEPFNANSSRLVSYQVAEDSGYGDCAPSYSFMGGGGFSTIVGRAEMYLVQGALDLGYYVVAPDYEGPHSVFTVGSTSGISTLNSIRAALSGGYNNVTGIDTDADVVLWGYSGGTIASGWAAALAPSYAEDLANNLKGAAMGGWVTNITATAEATEGTIFQGLVASAITGLSQQYPDIQKILAQHIFPNRTESYDKATKYCLVDALLAFAYQNIFEGPDRYADVGWDILSLPDVKKRLDENTLGINVTQDLIPEIPLFVFHGVRDEIVPFKDAERVYDVWCDQGIDSFEFAVSTSTGHILEIAEGSGAALSWITKIFEGEAPVQGCKRTERSSNVFYPGAISGGNWDIIKAFGTGVLGTKLGPDASVTGKSVGDGEIIKRLLDLD